MREKALLLASVASMIDQFNMSNIELLQSLDYEVHVACNFEDGNTCSNEKIIQLKNKLSYLNVPIYQIDFSRSVFNIRQNYKAYRCVKRIMHDNKYKFIHCHSPIGGAIGRLTCKATKTKCIYTAHGFHFYKGAPLKNWILYYPIEKMLSRYTDILITINKEDYERAKKHFQSKKIEYTHGVGINKDKFDISSFNRIELRNSIGLKIDDIMIFSVGELNKNKNHAVVIKAIAKLNNKHIHYYIAGQGELHDYLVNLIESLNLSNQIHLLGYRNDVNELYQCTDIYVHSSFREGLPTSVIEAMMSHNICLVSNIRGCNELINDNMLLFDPSNYNELAQKINILIHLKQSLIKKIVIENFNKAKEYDMKNINKEKIHIYEKLLEEF